MILLMGRALLTLSGSLGERSSGIPLGGGHQQSSDVLATQGVERLTDTTLGSYIMAWLPGTAHPLCG